jgi:hypothetical protein
MHQICQTANRPFLVAKCDDRNVALLFRPSCKNWSCPACGQTNKARWTLIAYHGAKALIDADHQVKFVTLTMPGDLTPSQTLSRWRWSWPRFSARFRRAAGRDRQYVYVHERQARGALHVHMMTNASMDTRWYKDNGRRTGFGFMNNARPVNEPEYAASYAAKYLAKALSDGPWSWPPMWRRITVSRAWERPETRDYRPVWSIYHLDKHQSLQGHIRELQHFGYETVVTDHNSAWQVVNHILDLYPDDIPDPTLCSD